MGEFNVMDYKLTFYTRNDLLGRYKDIPIQKVASYHITNMNMFNIPIDTIGIFIDFSTTLRVKYTCIYHPAVPYDEILLICNKKYNSLNRTNFELSLCCTISSEVFRMTPPLRYSGHLKSPSFILHNTVS